MKSPFIVVALVIFIVVQANKLYAQDLNFPAISPTITISDPLNGKFDLNLLATAKIRLGDHTIKGVHYPSHFLQEYTLLILSYKLNKHWMIGAGIGYEVNDPYLYTHRNNKRLIQQAIFTVPMKKARFTNRLRLEERWFRYHYDPPAFGTRLRYQAAYIRTLNEKALTWHLTNEIYMVPSGPRNSLITEDWISTGFGFHVKSLGHFETGVGLDTTTRNTKHDLNNLFLLQISWNLVITHKKRTEQ